MTLESTRIVKIRHEAVFLKNVSRIAMPFEKKDQTFQRNVGLFRRTVVATQMRQQRLGMIYRLSVKLRSLSEREGCLSLRSALASI